MKGISVAIHATVLAIVLGSALFTTAVAHHSAARYDTSTVLVMTGVVVRVDPAPNHLQLFFAPMLEHRSGVQRNADMEPVIWTVEMEPSARMADMGLSVNTFPPGTVFSVSLHPSRNGDTAGVWARSVHQCPARTPPPAGRHCDAVEGYRVIGGVVRSP